MRVVIFGATGMVGAGVLLECLDASLVESVLVVGRNPCRVTHPKLTEVILRDLSATDSIRTSLAGIDACFFCLGITSVGMSEADYSRIIYDFAMAAARSLLAVAPKSVFIYVSGEGTDSTARGRVMWARVKGRTENDLLGLGLRAAFMFRPGFIQPLRGVRSRTAWYQAFYTVLAPVTSLLRRLAPGVVTTTVDLGRAMIHVAAKGFPKPILRPADINRAAGDVV